MIHNKITGLLIISLFLFVLSGCRKDNVVEGPTIKQPVNIVLDTAYKVFKLADFETGVFPSTLTAGIETFGTYKILKDTTDQNINYYFSLVNSVNVTWDWYLGELRVDAVKFGNTDSIFHFKKLANMDSLNVSNTYLNFNLGGYSDITPNSSVLVQVITKNPSNAFTYSINLKWTGWKNISIPFDAFADATNATMSNIKNIKGIHFTFLFQKGKNTNKTPLSMLLDNIVVTQNKVYQFN